MSTDVTDDGRRQTESPGCIAAWILAASALHLILWFVVLVYFCFYIPRQKSVFEDFGVALPRATMLVIELSDLTVSYWYVMFPALFLSVVSTNIAIVALMRSRGWRLAMIVLLSSPPAGWLISCHLTLTAAMDRLMQALQ